MVFPFVLALAQTESSARVQCASGGKGLTTSSMFLKVYRPLYRAESHDLATHVEKGAGKDQAVLDNSIRKELAIAAVLIWVRDWRL
jgi:hypothetical protein